MSLPEPTPLAAGSHRTAALSLPLRAPSAAEVNPEDEPERREIAVRADMMSHFMRATRIRQRIGAGLMLVFAAFCWRHVDPAPLLTWLVCGLGVQALRTRMESACLGRGAFTTLAAQRAFVKAMAPAYIVQGAIWGSSVLLFFDRIPVYDQFGCWLIVACVASAPLTSVSLVPTLLRCYTNTQFSVMMIALLLSVAARDDRQPIANHLFLALPIAHWWLLNWLGRSIYGSHKTQYALQFDLARKEEEARAAVDVKNRFLVAATHDIRQPVTALSLYAEHLVNHPEMHLELAPKIAATTTAINRLFDSLFDLSTLQSGELALHLQDVDLAEVLHDLHNQYEPLAHASGLELRLRAADATVRSDPVRLRRMIGNVIGNAIKYSPPGKKILLAARLRGGRLCVEVWDQGFGIAGNEIGKVFQDFYRIDRGTAQAIDGMGLGLSIVLGLAKLLNTRIAVDSVEGRGTRFTLKLADGIQIDPSLNSVLGAV
ncbi:sensor histidine kinase [Variovorax sp. RT4R15]|uniref:sensor histidine kinase n=1 Tax=Variovorax sp. RT4R15 TaxID=3443737 RepID=UPI003F489157